MKNGNKYLAWAFIEAPISRAATARSQTLLRAQASATNNIVHQALAHKLARACYHMLKEASPST